MQLDEPYVFISYSRIDDSYVDRLVAHLADNGIAAWIDKGTDYGDDWLNIIGRRIRDCSAFIIVMTDNAWRSSWVIRERRYAETLKKTILPLLLSGETFWDLAHLQIEKVTTREMPPEGFTSSIRERLAAVQGVRRQVDFQMLDPLAATLEAAGMVVRDIREKWPDILQQALQTYGNEATDWWLNHTELDDVERLTHTKALTVRIRIMVWAGDEAPPRSGDSLDDEKAAIMRVLWKKIELPRIGITYRLNTEIKLSNVRRC